MRSLTKQNKSIVIFAAIIVIMIVIVVVLQPQKINLEEYVVLKYEGYDSYGTASARVDSKSLYDVIIKLQDENSDSYLDLLVGLNDCIANIDVALNKTERIYNGDKLTAEITYDNEQAKEFGIKFTGKSVSVKVENLPPIEEFNPFDDLEVIYSGIAPYGTVECNYVGDNIYLSDTSFGIETKNNLSNGEKINIFINTTNDKTAHYGYILTQKDKTYEVDGLPEYVDSYKTLDNSVTDTLKLKAKDKILEYVSTCNDVLYLDGLNYAGYVFHEWIPEATYPTDYYNAVYILYSSKISDIKGKFASFNAYFLIRFDNLIYYNDEISYNTPEICGEPIFSDSTHTIIGYTDSYDCYSELYEESAQKYKVEIGDGFKNM